MSNRECRRENSYPSEWEPGDLEDKQLYGGAIECLIPKGFADSSTVRTVPDYQEVFTNVVDDSGASLVIELLNFAEELKESDEVARHFFSDLAEATDSVSYDIDEISCRKAANGDSLVMVNGRHIHDKEGLKWTPLAMGIRRMPQYSSDMVVTLTHGSQSAGGFETSSVLEKNLWLILESIEVKDDSLFL
ncbi:Nuclear import protein MOG1, putative [Perkinsus marinus ATCC 50983]|uniref:Nuclear import protein MOG1, putative n=1 Tax=Perkinsus marinus (strain ATCC 50983 / TXsc) TaxID=423536 RepID=C5K979_PERM5|nr:Nuclear import protein MOG1, putative [Perkinsus marinus ATCC 50983]EER18985.1 Nuclear import protein MOG1, putative [Perkinsus marinus ATCC 50983]|eukprot:XP_002787189.1 Nuclear import protein MOG1, putative [Perkinsus marinus ATCC 50983]